MAKNATKAIEALSGLKSCRSTGGFGALAIPNVGVESRYRNHALTRSLDELAESQQLQDMTFASWVSENGAGAELPTCKNPLKSPGGKLAWKSANIKRASGSREVESRIGERRKVRCRKWARAAV